MVVRERMRYICLRCSLLYITVQPHLACDSLPPPPYGPCLLPLMFLVQPMSLIVRQLFYEAGYFEAAGESCITVLKVGIS